ncbi:uncharacterized protein LOC126374318 [Pectinophora gossypiella]|uniref:uncharacterized protein LOC126374318 n=1 Tax=Pectinophora gossypiella TaxID=13191 RepID=UPI00214EB208|nr:uncharacterized protein LOC126374318 [Pectinophora gossypiella]
MYRLSDNFYHRKCYFEREQVPTQTVMKDKMCESLALVYFKSMTPKLKVLAGLEPPMKGGGSEWFMPPKDLLDGRAVLKPVKKLYLNNLGFNGINSIGEKLRMEYFMQMLEEKRQALLDNDNMWKAKIIASNKKQYEESSIEEAEKNTAKIMKAFKEFEALYRTSVTRLEDMVYNAAIEEIKRNRKETFKYMEAHYADLVDYQARSMYGAYDEKLRNEKAKIKAKFIEDVQSIRTNMANVVHDINYDKHLAIEKLRHLLECQSLACQVYVALKEKEECQKEIDIVKHDHHKKVKVLDDEIAMKNFEIRLEIEQQLKRQEFDRIWKKKICHIVKKFQIFVEYCLKTLPEHAEFFLNMEKLMMLQINAAAENPSAESIIETEPEYMGPTPRPHPWYLFCDKGYKPQLEQDLCPKHCTSSASQIPVVVLNKRCIYAACNNYDVFTDKVTQYIGGNRGDDIDVQDDHDYAIDVPVKVTKSLQVEDLKLESSLMQILQQELPNIKELPIECCVCKIPYCFCSPLHTSKMSLYHSRQHPDSQRPEVEVDMGNRLKTRKDELRLAREPKWESYMDFIAPKSCKCSKMAKKHLEEHLPLYMRKTSRFEPPELPNYEPCRLETMRRLVKKARGVRTPPPPPPKAESKTRDVGLQCSDHEFDIACTCFSDQEIIKLFESIVYGSKIYTKTTETRVVGSSVAGSFMGKSATSFATDRAYSLRYLLDDAPKLEEIFKKERCDY